MKFLVFMSILVFLFICVVATEENSQIPENGQKIDIIPNNHELKNVILENAKNEAVEAQESNKADNLAEKLELTQQFKESIDAKKNLDLNSLLEELEKITKGLDEITKKINIKI